ncbi:MAG TPA: glucose-6-phosphate dehydrogenase [Chloroflexota bacterium]|nr:glucose-6-phosphate dehydrogenase [Chloroflexota bacterium]
MTAPTRQVSPAQRGIDRTAPPCVIVIFGASGDLTTRKLLPALYNLALGGLLSDRTVILGFARHQQGDDEFRETIRKGIDEFSRTRPVRKEVWDALGPRISYLQGQYDNVASFQQLRERLEQVDRERGTEGNYLFYVATPPSVFGDIVRNLGAAGLAKRGDGAGWSRLVIEKPFGHDLASARELNATILDVFHEDQVFRIDHYLGKETVQNILAFRFANRLWEPVWSSQHIDHVQITVAESIGLEGRASYYEDAGALRDVVQNHMLQLLALVAMEAPVTFEAEGVRDEKVKVLRALHPFNEHHIDRDAVRGQYTAGMIDGKPVPGYREEPKVDPRSRTETFVALKVGIDTWRWAGTPFYLRHGKRLPSRVSEIAVQFKPVPHLPFAGAGAKALEPDLLLLRLQPNEGIVLRFGAKQPGPEMQLRSVDMEFTYEKSFSMASPDAYERLILDCAVGDHTLFTRADEVELSWAFIDQVLEGWREQDSRLYPYPAGTWGPDAARELLERDGRHWHNM